MVEQVTFQTLFQFLQTVSIIVGISYYIMVLNNQQKNQRQAILTRQGQFLWQMIGYSSSKEGYDSYTIVGEAEWSSYEEWAEKYGNDPEYFRAFNFVSEINDGLGVLLREGSIDTRIIASFAYNAVIGYWEKYEDVLMNLRRETYRGRFRNWEYAYDALKEYFKEHPELSPY